MTTNDKDAEIARLNLVLADHKATIANLMGAAARAEIAGAEATGNPRDWMVDGSLLYRLGDDGANCDEINVTMIHGSRGALEREAAAAGLLCLICAADCRSAAPVAVIEHASPGQSIADDPEFSRISWEWGGGERRPSAFKVMCDYIDSRIAVSAAPVAVVEQQNQKIEPQDGLVMRPFAAPASQRDAARAAQVEAVARTIFQAMPPRPLVQGDWDSGAILGYGNHHRINFRAAAKEVLALLSGARKCDLCNGNSKEHDSACILAAPLTNLSRAEPASQQDAGASGWISVDDRLPPENELVAVLFWPYDNHENTQIVGSATYFDGSFYNHEGEDHHPPSHWLPIPPVESAIHAAPGASRKGEAP